MTDLSSANNVTDMSGGQLQQLDNLEISAGSTRPDSAVHPTLSHTSDTPASSSVDIAAPTEHNTANTDSSDLIQSYASIRSWFSKSPPSTYHTLPPQHANVDTTTATARTDKVNSASTQSDKAKSLSTSPKPSICSTLFGSSDSVQPVPLLDSAVTPTSAELPQFSRTASTPHSAPAQSRNRSVRSVSAADSAQSSSVLDTAIAWIRKKSSSHADVDEVDPEHYARMLAQQRDKERQQRLKQQAKQIKQAELVRQQWLNAFQQFHEFRQSARQLQQLCWNGIPSSLRARAWIEIVGNSLHITQELYTILHARATELRHTVRAAAEQDAYINSAERRASRSEEQYQKEESLRCIIKDVPRMYMMKV